MNDEEILRQYKTQAENKETIRNMYKFYNARDWENYSKIVDDRALSFASALFDDEMNLIIEKSNNFYYQISKNMDELFRIAQERSIKVGFDNPEDFRRFIKLEAEIEQANMTPKLMVAENDEVWAFVIHKGIEIYSGKPTEWTGLVRHKLESGKLVAMQIIWNYLNVLIDIGKIRIEMDDKTVVNQYLDDLRVLGMIPAKS